MLVATWMTADPLTVEPNTRFLEAKKLMEEHGIRHLPVVKGGKLVGIMTLNDVRRVSPSPATTFAAGEVNYLFDKMEVRDAMTKDPITVTPETPVEDAALLAYQHKIGALPVVQGDRLVGIITQTDLFDIMMSVFKGGEGDRRITIEGMPAVLGSIRKVVDILDSHGTRFSSILTFPQRDGELYTYFVRIADSEADAIVEDLKNAGLPVTHIS
jgi:acetoin utilization protein AcuB